MGEAVFQVGIKALIRNAKGHILLTREMNHDVVWWDIPGGRIDNDDEIIQTLERELQEEVSLIPPFSYEHFMTVVSNKRVPAPTLQYRLLVIYSIELHTEQILTSNEHGREIAWVAPKEAAIHLADKFPREFCDKVALLA